MDPAGNSAVFTAPYGIELLAEAYREGLVTTASASGSALTETEQNIVDTIDQHRKETVLQQIALRENLYVPERVIEYNGPTFESNSFVIEDSELARLVCTYSDALEPSDRSLVDPAHRAKQRAKELEWCLDNGMISPLYTMMTGRDEFDLGIDQFSGFIKRLSGRDPDEDNVPSVAENKSLADAITQYLYQLRHLIEQSEAAEGPIVADTNVGQLKNARQPDITGSEHRSVALYFNNLKSVDISSVEQALKVRESAHVQDFRDEVLGTISDIRSNDVAIEDVESRIEAANRALERAGVAAKSRKLLCVLPILAPDPVIGTASAIGTGATFAYEFYAEQIAYDWAFVSSCR